MRRIWIDPFFLVGFLFIAGIITFSIYHQYGMDNVIPEEQIRYDEDGVLLDKAPFKPSAENWFGTDQFGQDLFYILLSGAKYTLSLAILIGLLRLMISLAGGILLSFLRPEISRFITGITQSFYYLPVVLVVFFLELPIVESPVYTFWEKVIFQITIMVAVAVPSTSVLIKEEINIVLREEFVTNAKIMGGSKWHIFFQHVLPQLRGKVLLLFMQQTIAALTLLAHLGILAIFIGGTFSKVFVFDLDFPEEIPTSLSFEWSGLLGSFYAQLPYAPHLVVFPVLLFGLSILAMNFMIEGLIRSFNDKRRITKTVKKKTPQHSVEEASYSFLFLKKTG
ncbi:ABC transporter permease subunit [Fictibacillus nanhaiensis]|uniref:ABC transporter permease n=1 Tax=Fictibacillus nanhaiensis TaxID=742169 RepID=UPI001C97F07A|nr:ABC transporter permease subunit [Fictibacillus nanhaiensis]MBY6038313.1 ABC transporter permease subunit [Fictibacillus nanhaiensis]